MKDDFVKQFQSVTDALGSAAKGLMGKLDHFTFKMLIDNLKSNDTQVVLDTIETIENEKKPLSIPPLYFVMKNHPNQFIRNRAEKALYSMVPQADVERLTAGKPIEEAVKAMIMEYGNYKF